MDRHLYMYLEACKAAKGLENEMHLIEKFLASILLFVQARKMDAITDQCNIEMLRNPSMEYRATEDTEVAG